jgi:hypothetical protein
MILAARNVQIGGSIRGGHGAASFDVYTDNAYLQPPHELRKGEWVEIYDSGHELYEGEVLSVTPVVDISGQHKYAVECGGLFHVAAKRGDLTKTWVRRGAAAWLVHPDANKAGEYSVGSDGALQLLVRDGATTEFATPMHVVFYLDGLLSGDVISHIDWTAEWDVTDEAPYAWSWLLSCDATVHSEADSASVGTSGSYTPAGSSQVAHLYLTGGAAHTVNGDRWVRFTQMDVFGSSKVAKVRVDEAMVDVAVRPGLATSSVSEAVGRVFDDLHFEKTNAAAMLSTLAGLNASPFDWGFWDQRTYYVRPLDRVPSNPARVVAVGGPNPGLVSWGVTPADEEMPDYVCVLFGNKDDATLPEGFVRQLYVPCDPPDDAGLAITTVNHGDLILSDGAAANIGAQLLGAGALFPADRAVLDVHPEFARAGQRAGNNTDPTDDYAQLMLPDAPTGTLTGFSFAAGSGWEGENSPLDPTCLVFDGVDDCVTWGDVAWADFGTGDFSLACWFRLDALGVAHTLVSKHDNTATGGGFKLIVTDTDNLYAVVASYAAGISNRRCVLHGTFLTTDVWYHAAMTWEGATDGLHVYLNGVENAALTWTLGTVGDISSASELRLGAAA